MNEPIAVDVAIPVIELKSLPEPNKIIIESQPSKEASEISESREDPVALVEIISQVQAEGNDLRLLEPVAESLKSVVSNDKPLVEPGNPSSDAALKTLLQNVDD